MIFPVFVRSNICTYCDLHPHFVELPRYYAHIVRPDVAELHSLERLPCSG